MALKVKAVERLLKFDKESAGKYRYVMKADLYTSQTLYIDMPQKSEREILWCRINALSLPKI